MANKNNQGEGLWFGDVLKRKDRCFGSGRVVLWIQGRPTERVNHEEQADGQWLVKHGKTHWQMRMGTS